MSVACEPSDYTQHRCIELDVSYKCAGFSSVYPWIRLELDLGKRLIAMFSHRRVEPAAF